MKKLAASFLFLIAASAVADGVGFDRMLATELSKAYLKAYFRNYPTREVIRVIYEDAIIESAMDGNGRKFVFVGFKAESGTAGATMHLEVCGSPIGLQPSFYGASLNVLNDREDFLHIAGNPTADYPGTCYTHE